MSKLGEVFISIGFDKAKIIPKYLPTFACWESVTFSHTFGRKKITACRLHQTTLYPIGPYLFKVGISLFFSYLCVVQCILSFSFIPSLKADEYIKS
jgi:hypothetical protein